MIRSTPRLTLALAFAAAVASSDMATRSSASALPFGPATPEVGEVLPRGLRLGVYVHWEGRDVEPFNLEALAAFRSRFSDIDLVHFLSPAPLLKPGADAAAVATRIRSAMRAGDSVVLSLAGWKTLANASGVIFRQGPTFWGETLGKLECARDCGLDVPVSVYPPEDLAKLIDTGLVTLANQGFGRPKGVVALGWSASPSFLEAAARAGIRYDFSAVAPEIVAKRGAHYPLFQWTKGLWSDVTPHAQPRVVSTPAGTIVESPQSLANLDYMSLEELLGVVDEYVARVADREAGHGSGDTNGYADLTLPLVIQMESIRQTLPILDAALPEIFRRAALKGVAVRPLQYPDLAVPAGNLAH